MSPKKALILPYSSKLSHPQRESLIPSDGEDEMMVLVSSNNNNTARKPLKESITENSDDTSAQSVPNHHSDGEEGEFETINAWELMDGLLEDENDEENEDSSIFVSAEEAKLPFQSELQSAQQRILSSPSSSKTEVCFSYKEGFCWLHNVSFGRFSHSQRFRSFPSLKGCIIAGSLGMNGSKTDSEKADLRLPCSLTKAISMKEDRLANSVSMIRSKAGSEKAIDSIPCSSKNLISATEYRIDESLDTVRRKAEAEKAVYSLPVDSKKAILATEDCLTAASASTIRSKSNSEKAIPHLPRSSMKAISVPEDWLTDSDNMIRTISDSEKGIDSLPRSSKKLISVIEDCIADSVNMIRSRNNSEKRIDSLPHRSNEAISMREDCITDSVSMIRRKNNSEKRINNLSRSSKKGISVAENHHTDSNGMIRSESDTEKRIDSLSPSSTKAISVPEDCIADSVSMIRRKNNSEKRINNLSRSSKKGISVAENHHTDSNGMIRSESDTEKRIDSLSPSSTKAISVPEDCIADSVSMIGSRGDSEKAICSVAHSFAERTLSFKFLLDGSNSGEASFDEGAPLSPSASSEIILKTADCPSCPPSPDFFITARNSSLLQPSVPCNFLISEDPGGKLLTEDSQPNCVNHSEKGGTCTLLNRDAASQSDSNASEPFFDPELLDSLEEAIAQLTEEEWNEMAEIGKRPSSCILGYGKEQDSGTKCWL